MARYALFVANARYRNPGLQPLHGPDEDVDDLSGLFRHRLDYDEVLALKAASADEVSVCFGELGRKAAPGDTVLFYFSGHGVESRDGKEQYLLFEHADLSELGDGVNTPTGCLAVSKLLHSSSGWRGVHRVFIFDACRTLLAAKGSGTAGPRFGREESLDVLARGPVLSIRGHRTQPAEPPVLIKACLSSQQALELPARRRGIFSLALGQALIQAARSGQRVTTGPDLLAQIQQHMSTLLGQVGGSPTQTPWICAGAPEVPLFEPTAKSADAAARTPTRPSPTSDSAGGGLHPPQPETAMRTPARLTVPVMALAVLGAVGLSALAILAWRPVPPAPVQVAAVPGPQPAPPTPIKSAERPRQGVEVAAPKPAASRTAQAASPRPGPRSTEEPAVAARPEPTPAAPVLPPAAPHERYLDLASLPAGQTAVMAAQGSSDLVAQVRRHLSPSQLNVFRNAFFTEGLFERAMSGDGAPIAQLKAQHRVTVFRFLRVDEPRFSQPDAQLQGAVEATATVHYREIDPASGGTLRNARIELRGAGFSREKALRDLGRDLDEKSNQLN